jgi:hypothetical protein
MHVSVEGGADVKVSFLMKDTYFDSCAQPDTEVNVDFAGLKPKSSN